MSQPARWIPAPLRARLRSSAIYRDLSRRHSVLAGQYSWGPLLEGDTGYGAGRGDEAAPKVLVATVGGGYLQGAQMESLLAVALTVRGADVHVLLCDGVMPACQECTIDWYPNEEKFARSGPTRRHCDTCFQPASEMYGSVGATVHRYSELITAGETEQARRQAAELAVSDIPGYVLDGIRVGEHAKAGTLRFFGRGSLEGTDGSEPILRRYLEAALLTFYATNRLLAQLDFQVAVFHHGIYVPQGVVGETARERGVRVVNWNVAYRRNCFMFSHHDTYHHTLLSEPTSTWETMQWSDQIETQLMDYLKSRWSGTNDWVSFHRDPELGTREIAHETGVDFSKPCVGMLTNVIWDAQLHYPANAFPSMLDWAEKTIAYFADRPELELLIRVHPAELSGFVRSRQPFVEAISQVFPALTANVHIIAPESRVSTYAAMERCNAVLIFGTKTGVELTATGIPVVVAGEAWVRNKGITLDAASETDYFRLLDSLPLADRLAPDTVERARKYAYHFFFRRMIPLEFATQLLGTPGFEWQIDSLADLAPGASRGLDVICDGILAGTPFVYPAEEVEALARTGG